MNRLRKNIIYVGSDSYYKDDLKLYDYKDDNGSICINNNYFHLAKINNLGDLDRKKGFLVILTLDDLYDWIPSVADIFEPDVYEIDRYVRKKFENFEYVIIISIEEFDYGHIPFSNMYVEFANKYFDTDKGISLLVDKLYKEYKNKKELNITRIKNINIERLRNYVEEKEFITTKEMIDDLGVNEKWIQRYMKDMNIIYNNIGYNKRKRVWYTVKNNY